MQNVHQIPFTLEVKQINFVEKLDLLLFDATVYTGWFFILFKKRSCRQ